MNRFAEIERLIAADSLLPALDMLNLYIASHSDDDEAFLMRGKLNWRLQRRAEAVTDFEHALAINPASPAERALQVARDVFDYYNPDLLNP